MMPLPARDIALALVVGLGSPWVIAWLMPYVDNVQFSAFGPVITFLAHDYGWTKDQIWPLFRIAAALFHSVVFGLVIGFPLGLAFSRRWFECWLAFLVGFLIAHYVGALYSPLGLGLFVVNLLLPEFWLDLGGTLLFAFLGQRARQLHASGPARA